MKLSNYFSRLNWRQIVIHFVATWFFIESFKTFGYIHDLKAYELFQEGHNFNQAEWSRFISDMNWMYTTPYIGLLIAILISFIISIQKKWFWLNSVIVLFLGYSLQRLNVLGWTYLKSIFLSPGQYFDHHSIQYYLAVGIPMLSLGLILFFSKFINRLINDDKNKITVKELPTT